MAWQPRKRMKRGATGPPDFQRLSSLGCLCCPNPTQAPLRLNLDGPKSGGGGGAISEVEDEKQAAEKDHVVEDPEGLCQVPRIQVEGTPNNLILNFATIGEGRVTEDFSIEHSNSLLHPVKKNCFGYRHSL